MNCYFTFRSVTLAMSTDGSRYTVMCSAQLRTPCCSQDWSVQDIRSLSSPPASSCLLSLESCTPSMYAIGNCVFITITCIRFVLHTFIINDTSNTRCSSNTIGEPLFVITLIDVLQVLLIEWKRSLKLYIFNLICGKTRQITYLIFVYVLINS